MPYAYGQIIANEANSPRLGKHFIGELIEECVKIYQTDEIHLFVYENNIGAIKCYEKLGFKFNNDATLTLVHRGKDIRILKMTLKIKG